MSRQHSLLARVSGMVIAGAVAIISAGPARAADAGAAIPTVQTGSRAVTPNFAGTVALPVKAERYWDSWERARRQATGNPRLEQLIAPARAMSRDSQAAYVQAAVNRNIRWMSDATEWGSHDYWASAAETLNRGAGDMEDRAILKMEALKNLGVPARDLYLTMGRDKVAGPVIVLIARIDGRYLLFDDSGVAPKPVDFRPDFEPMLSFGHGGAWLHGKRRVSTERIAAKTGPEPRVRAR